MITWREITIKYKQSVMGLLWAVLMPIVIVGAGVVVRVGLAFLSGRPLALADVAAVSRQGGAVGVLRLRHPVRDQQPDREREPGHEDLHAARDLPARRPSCPSSSTSAWPASRSLILLAFAGVGVSVQLLWVPAARRAVTGAGRPAWASCSRPRASSSAT